MRYLSLYTSSPSRSTYTDSAETLYAVGLTQQEAELKCPEQADSFKVGVGAETEKRIKSALLERELAKAAGEITVEAGQAIKDRAHASVSIHV